MISTLQRKGVSAARLADRGARKLFWQLTHPRPPGAAAPVFIVGAQRSGTTMLGDCLARSSQVSYYPEHDRTAFDNFVLREDVWPALVARCRLPIIAFKPLTSSHLARDMLARYAKGRVIWALRHPSDRARSAVAKFGQQNLKLLQQLAGGERPDVWQTQGLEQRHFDLIGKMLANPIDAAGAAALFWYLRNDLFFAQALDRDDRAQVVCYERLVSAPAQQMEHLCNHLGIPYQPRLSNDIHARSVRCDWPTGSRGDLIELCDALYDRLAALSIPCS
ncbi:MAG: sulfotransferase [Pseudomonadota bacterium]